LPDYLAPTTHFVGDYEQAFADLNWLIENSPQYSVKALFERAMAYHHKKEYKEAKRDYDEVFL
jgi:tetratricopeptide (TPR) repeat protein